MTVINQEFVQALKEYDRMVTGIFNEERYRDSFRPEALRQAVYSYLIRPAKRIRPGILFLCCEAVGGAQESAKLAAASVEVFHTWTLVHDDIIDNDAKRRGAPTVHEAFRVKALEWGYSPAEAADLGKSVAILTGDLQHAWSVRLLLDSSDLGVPHRVVLDLVKRLETDVTNGLVEGEALDVLYSRKPIAELREDDILMMLELKTGVLLEYAAIAGASIGLAQTVSDNPIIPACGRFARQCGVAFQLQDDILGITGDEMLLGKPVGSDIREGKRTVIVQRAYQTCSPAERIYLEKWLGNPSVSEREIETIKGIFTEQNAIEYTRRLAETIVDAAVREIDVLPPGRAKEYLLKWADYVVKREF